MSQLIISRMEFVGCKTALRLVERATFTGGDQAGTLASLEMILDDRAGDRFTTDGLCEVL